MLKQSFLISFLYLFTCSVLAQNQQHKVQKGENVYRISLKYGVSMQDIFRANPGSQELIRAGQTLIIPNSNTLTSSNAGSESGRHIVKRGETKYGLSKQFGISISELEKTNPQIVKGLQTGQILNVPKNKKVAKVNSQANSSDFHTIKKGETLWSISQQYNKTLQDILDLNNGISINNLQVGQQIKVGAATKNVLLNNDVYVIKKGDTKFSLSKRFNVTISELENKNPQIKEELITGQQIQIPSGNSEISETNSATSNNTSQEKQDKNSKIEEENAYVSYTIKPKETLYSLSKKAGLSIAEFTALNPELENQVLSGTIIKMPVSATTEEAVSTDNKTDDSASNKNSVSVSSWISSMNKDAKKEITWILPSQTMEQLESSTLLSAEKKEAVSKAYETYHGGKKAIEKLKAMGFQIKENIVTQDKLNSKNKLESFSSSDLIIATTDLGNYKLENTMNNPNSSLLNLYPKNNIKASPATAILNASPDFNAKSTALIDYIDSKKGNIVIINDQNSVKSNYTQATNNSKISKLTVESNDMFKESELINLLNPNKLNFVIIDSDKASVFLNTTNALLRQFSKYDIQIAVFDKEMIPSSQYISSKRFRILRLIFPSTLKLEVHNAADTEFKKNYINEFSNDPESSAYIGYDATLDALVRIFQSQPLSENILKPNTELDFMDFNYKRNSDNSVSNSSIFIFQFGQDSGFIRVN